MTQPFQGPELVLGGFKSLRAFQVSIGKLTSVTHSHDFVSPDDTYIAQCGNIGMRLLRNRTGTVFGVDKIFDVRKLPGGAIFLTASLIREVRTPTGRKAIVSPASSWKDWNEPHKYHYTTVNYEETYTVSYEMVVTDFSFTKEEVEKVEHAVPLKGCTCGFYSFYEMANEADQKQYIPRCETAVWGVVENYGRVIHGTKGLRAEKTRVVAITGEVIPKAFESVRYLNMEEMLEAHPLSSIEGLFEEVPND